MIKIAICDDEKYHLNLLENMLKNILNKNNLEANIFKFSSSYEFLEFQKNSFIAFDLILLDILMDGLNGLDLAKEIRNLDLEVKILFISTSKDYILDGYDVHAYNYLLKPVSYFKLEYVILDFIDNFNNLKNNLFTVKNKQSIFRINLDNIIFFESKLRKINIVFSNYSEISFYDKLDNIEDALISKNFIRCHKSYLVNLNYIKKIENSKIITLNNNIIPISRSYLKKTKDIFFEYFRCKAT